MPDAVVWCNSQVSSGVFNSTLYLQSEITELEKTRESMAKELVNLTTKNDQLEENLDTLVTLQQQYKVGLGLLPLVYLQAFQYIPQIS